MSVRADWHTHTTWCDGADTPAAMARAALERGMEGLGFSGHSYTAFDESYCMSKEGTLAYRREIAALKEEYAGRLRILCGIEQDAASGESTASYDYVIGSVHYVKPGTDYLPVDESAAAQHRAVETAYGGDWYAFAEDYFETLGGVVRRTGADIIGHFDLIAKFNERERLFDERHPRYRAAWKRAADRLLAEKRVFELNTGAVSRGYRSVPYPAPEILAYLLAHGARLILSSDSHRAGTLCYGFEEYEKELKRRDPSLRFAHF